MYPSSCFCSKKGSEVRTNHEVRLPEVEVIVKASAFDVLVVSFYAGRTVHDDFEIVAGIEEVSDVPRVVQILEECIKTLRAGGWQSVDELDTRALSGGTGEPPF